MKQSILYLFVILAGLWVLPRENSMPSRTPSSVAVEKFPLIVTGFDQNLDLSTVKDFEIFKSYIERMISEVDKDSGNKFWGPAYFRLPGIISTSQLKIILNYFRTENNPEKLAILHHSLELKSGEINKIHGKLFHKITTALSNFQHYFIAPFVKGRMPAQNINPEESVDLSLIDPFDSPFWKRPINIPGQNLYLGFDRSNSITLSESPCQLAESALLDCSGKKYKVKFSTATAATASSPAFTSRIFWALGFNVEAIDFQTSLKLSYTPHLAPAFIREINLTNGKVISGKELIDFLPKNADQVASIITFPLQIQEVADEQLVTGPWDWNNFNFKNMREMRGIVLLAAWLNLSHFKLENNQIHFKDNQFKFIITDWEPLSDFSVLDPAFTDSNAKGKAFKIKNFHTALPNQPFHEATVDDVKWMARLIRSLTNKQISDALKAAGFSPDEQDKSLEKLLIRREKMLKDLGL